MSFLPERGCPGSVQAECRGREQLTRLRSGQPPLPGAAGAGRGGGGAPGAAGAGHPAQPLPRSPPFISPRLAPARSPGPSTAPSLAPPPPPPSPGTRRSVPALLTLRSACVLHGLRASFRPGLAVRVPAAPHGAPARANCPGARNVEAAAVRAGAWAAPGHPRVSHFLPA